MRYYKRQWDETTGEELTDSWGKSTYYFETDEDFNVIRQIQFFENGQVLKYSSDNLGDEFGSLSDQPIDSKEFEDYIITDSEFKKMWGN